MSESAPEPRPSGGKKENVLTRKLGPLPTWAWVAIVAAALILWAYYKNKQSGQQQAGGATAGAGQVPQFVNQTFTTLIPPTAPGPDNDVDHDRHPKPPPPSLLPWHDESKKDRRIRNWEHKHPGQEYPWNKWEGNPTKAQLDEFNDLKQKFQPPLPSQSTSFPMNQGTDTGGWEPRLGNMPTVAGPVSGVEGAPEQMMGGTVSGKKMV